MDTHIDRSEPEFWNWIKSITNQFLSQDHTLDWTEYIQQVAQEQGIHLEYDDFGYHEITTIRFNQPHQLTHFRLVYNQIHERT